MACPVGLATGGALASLRADRVIGFLLERQFSMSSMVLRTRSLKLLFGLFSLIARIGSGMSLVSCLYRQLESYRDGSCPPCYWGTMRLLYRAKNHTLLDMPF